MALVLWYRAVNFARRLKHFCKAVIKKCIERADDMLWLAYSRHVAERRAKKVLTAAIADQTLTNFFQRGHIGLHNQYQGRHAALCSDYGAAVTVTAQVSVKLPSAVVAVIVAVPAATAVTRPVELTVAMDAAEVVQVIALLVASVG
jgi:hypothetical protein